MQIEGAMRISAGLVAKKESDEVAAAGSISPIYYYTCCVLSYAGGGDGRGFSGSCSLLSRPLYDFKYAVKSSGKIKWFSIVQLLMGLAVFAIQIYPTYWSYYMLGQRHVNIRLASDAWDYSMPGIWCGAWILFTGVFGLVAARTNHRALVGCYMGLNVGAIAFATTLIVLSSISVSEVMSCKLYGSWAYLEDNSYRAEYDRYSRKKEKYDNKYGVDGYARLSDDNWRSNKQQLVADDYDYDDAGRPRIPDRHPPTDKRPRRTTPPPPTLPSPPPTFEVLGETFPPKFKESMYTRNLENKFYCEHPLFTGWLAAEALMIVMAFGVLFVTIWAIVLGINANFLCCRKCCKAEANEKDEKVTLIPIDQEENLHI